MSNQSSVQSQQQQHTTRPTTEALAQVSKRIAAYDLKDATDKCQPIYAAESWVNQVLIVYHQQGGGAAPLMFLFKTDPDEYAPRAFYQFPFTVDQVREVADVFATFVYKQHAADKIALAERFLAFLQGFRSQAKVCNVLSTVSTIAVQRACSVVCSRTSI